MSTICKIYLHMIIYMNENYSCENAEMNKRTILSRICAWALPVFFYDTLDLALKPGRLFIVAVQLLLKLLVCIARIV